MREFRCCKEMAPSLGVMSFDGSIEKISCITEHEEYQPLTHAVVLRQVAPLLKNQDGRTYRRRAGQSINE